MATTRALCLVALLAVLVVGSTNAADCKINVNGGLPDPQPLILKVGGTLDVFGFHLPDSAGIVTIPDNTDIRLVCAGPTNYFLNIPGKPSDVLAKCRSGPFEVNGNTYTFPLLSCSTLPVHVATTRTTNLEPACTNNNNHILVDIGFQIGAQLIKTILVCFDEQNRNAVWSKVDLVKEIGGYQVGFPTPPKPPQFAAASFYPGLDPDTQYKQATQLTTLTTLLGAAQANKYITSTQFLTRGHLTANIDFVYGSEMRSTYYFINVAPQWTTFNGRNWNILEGNTRDYAASRGLNLVVYTGTYGITTLPDTNNNPVDIYLYLQATGNKIPVPAVYWKVVYDPISQRGVALIGANNPYMSKTGIPTFCTIDVCSQIRWLTWVQNNQVNGYGFCCDVNDFRTTVKSLPPFIVKGLLT